MKQETRWSISASHLRLLTVTALVTYLLVTLGGLVCMTDSSQGCPDWPWCYGKPYPPLRQDSIIEYTHRVAALLTSLLIVASAAVSLIKTPRLRWVSIPATLSILFLVAVSFFGALAVTTGLSRGWAAVDLGSALITLALMIIAAFAARSYHQSPGKQIRFSLRAPLAGLVFATTAAAFILLVSGVLAAESGSVERCLGLPLFGHEVFSAGTLGVLQVFRRVLAGAIVVLVAVLAVQAGRIRTQNAGILLSIRLLAGALAVELVTGMLMVNTGFSLVLQFVYASMATAIWGMLIVLLMQTAAQAFTRE